MSGDAASATGTSQQHLDPMSAESPSELRRQMREIEARRAHMNAQQRELGARRAGSAAPQSDATNSQGGRRSQSRCESLYGTMHDPPGATHTEPIVVESKRREHLARTPYYEMKEAMRQAWHRDSALVSGFFTTREVGKGGTFGRAERFAKPVGMKEQYYLSNDIQAMQSRAVRLDRRRYSVATRGNIGTNVNSHWNDSKGGCAPGPGAYTPRPAAASSASRRY